MLKKQILRFLFVGAVNTVIYFILYSIFVFVGFDYKLAVLFATILGILFSFHTLGRFVFYNNDKKLIYRFILVYTALYLVNILCINIFESVFSNYYISGFIASLLIAVLTFILNRNYVFKKGIMN